MSHYILHTHISQYKCAAYNVRPEIIVSLQRVVAVSEKEAVGQSSLIIYNKMMCTHYMSQSHERGIINYVGEKERKRESDILSHELKCHSK